MQSNTTLRRHRYGAFSAMLLPVAVLMAAAAISEEPFLRSELIFPPETWHNHASCIVEVPNGDLWVCWFHGSGERTADDVKIEGARKRAGQPTWGPRMTLADTPGYPDTNCAMVVDPAGRLWLLWPTILAHRWETALMKVKIASEYSAEGPPLWETETVIHVTPGVDFAKRALPFWEKTLQGFLAAETSEVRQQQARDYFATLRVRAEDELARRLGWMTRAHPLVLDGARLIVPLYSDGFDCSLMAMTDDWGATWHTSTPLLGLGNIQPSIVQRRDGSLFTLMRDNGPPPHRLHQSESRDRGQTWSAVTDSDLPNPGSGAEIIRLRNGNWVLISNDTEEGRHSLAVQISEDEGHSWPWKRHLEKDEPGPFAGRYHYPSLIQASDGSLHASYSYHLHGRDLPRDVDGDPSGKSIKHAHFNEAWVRGGQSSE